MTKLACDEVERMCRAGPCTDSQSSYVRRYGGPLTSASASWSPPPVLVVCIHQ